MSKHKTAFLKEENLLTLLSQNNFIIPEIQREYVWGNHKEVIFKFFTTLKNKIGAGCFCCNIPTSREKINIGFLYSYKPDYVKVEQGRFLDVSLIDGQQRLTTLFLLLFYLGLKEEIEDDFKALIRFEKDVSMSLNFNVRDITRRFLLELVEKTKDIDALQNIEEQTWFLKDYENDVSVKCMLKTLKYIRQEFSTNIKYYDHLLKHITFWHFKTEATSQGEELYITMNARGKKLAKNESKKADLMKNVDLTEWGKEWEEWQHFFWIYRKKDKNKIYNADYGFNEFLRWYDDINSKLITDTNFSEKEKFEKIQSIFKAFKNLIDKQDEIISHNNSEIKISDVFNFKKLIELNILNNDEPLINKSDKFILYSGIMYILNRGEGNINLLDLYRFIRIIKNTVTHKKSNIDIAIKFKSIHFDDVIQLKDNKEEIISAEEILKLKIYDEYSNTREEIEAKFWETENHFMFNYQIKQLIKYNQENDSYDHNIFLVNYNHIKNNFPKLNQINDDIRFALLCLNPDIQHIFHDGRSWGCDRYNIGTTQNIWQKIGSSNLILQLLSQFNAKKTLENIILEGIENEHNTHIKNIKFTLFTKARDFWQWNNNKIFFYNDDEIFFPNGAVARSNTATQEIQSAKKYIR